MNTLQQQYHDEIELMVETCRRVSARRFVTSHGGNLSWRVGDDDVLITPTQVAKGAMTFDDIVVVGMDESVHFAAEGRRPTGEAPIHLRILQARPDIHSVIHAHPVWLTALALSRPDLLARPFLPEPTIEVGPVAVTEYATPLTEDLARTFDPVLQRHNAFVMRNHGAVVLCSEGIGRCFELLEILEATAESVSIAEVLGGAQTLNDAQIADLNSVMQKRNLPMPGAPGQVKDLRELYD